jgi:hypothetical protein
VYQRPALNFVGLTQLTLANVTKRIGDLFEYANEILDSDELDKLTKITAQLREEVVRANVILDRLKVPD